MSDQVNSVIGKSPLQVAEQGLAALTNQLIQAGKVHICGTQIVSGPSTVNPPLLVVYSKNPGDPK